MLHLDFKNCDKSKWQSALWAAVKSLFMIYQKKIKSKSQLLRNLIKEVDWNLKMNLKVGSKINFVYVKDKILKYLGG